MNLSPSSDPILNPKSITDDNQYLFMKKKTIIETESREADSYNEDPVLAKKFS